MQNVMTSSDSHMEECGICYLDYGQERRPRPLAACRHVVCSDCLEHLAARAGEVTCPFCRAPSPLPSDEEEGGEGDVAVKGPLKWLKKLCKKTKSGSRRRGSLASEDVRDLAMMCSYFM
ncbi:RING finger protein 227 [Hyperolius riggenbachi]|uniref:RING finger protein 227 n=1 Tax=Hyperolius riggenbachi TaxID=752182 RepID=UPI0035A2A3DF